MTAGQEGPRVILRAVRKSDLETLFHQQLDPESSAMAAFPPRGREAFFAHWYGILGDPDAVTRTVVSDNEVAGNVLSWVQDEHREIGYWIGKAYWGRGIATAALRQFVDIVSERPLCAWVFKHNAGSIRVLEKIGFVHDGQEKDHLIYKLR